MPRIAHRMRAHYVAIGYGLLNICLNRVSHTQSKRPERAEIVLRLDCAKPVNDPGGFFKRLLGNELVVQAQARNIQIYHSSSHAFPSLISTQWPFFITQSISCKEDRIGPCLDRRVCLPSESWSLRPGYRPSRPGYSDQDRAIAR